MYEYKATLKRVVDGDTVWLRVDLGFRTFMESDFRLYGIDAPEKSGPKADPVVAKAASDYLYSMLADKDPSAPIKTFTVKSHGPDKYGRWLAVIILPDGTHVNDMMIAAGHAVPYRL